VAEQGMLGKGYSNNFFSQTPREIFLASTHRYAFFPSHENFEALSSCSFHLFQVAGINYINGYLKNNDCLQPLE